MTYRQLARKILDEFTSDQLDMDVTVVDMGQNESFAALLSFVEPENEEDFGLEDNHPFFYANTKE